MSKAQAKMLSTDRVKQTMRNDTQWKDLAGKLSKNQIVQLDYDDLSSSYFSLNKVYKLFINRTISEKYIFDRLANLIKDSEKRTTLLKTGLDYNFVVNSPEGYLEILKKKPLYQSLNLIKYITFDQVTPEIANEIISKLTESDMYYLRNFSQEVVDKIWSTATYRLTDEQHKEIERHVFNCLDKNDTACLQYINSSSLIFTPIVQKIKAALSNKNIDFRFANLSPARAFVLFKSIPDEMAPFITEEQFVYLVMNNALHVRTHLKNRYYEFLTRNPNEFVKVWNQYPNLHNEIIKNMKVDPKLVIHNISTWNLFWLAKSNPELHQEHKDRLSGSALADFVHNYPGRLIELNLTAHQIIEFLKIGNLRQHEMFLNYIENYEKELIEFDQQLKFINLLPVEYLDRIANYPGVRERLADNWDGENMAHAYLGTLFLFNPKDFQSSKWYLYCHIMQNNHFNAWINSKPKLTVDQVISAYSKLQHMNRKVFIQRARKIWDCEHEQLIKSKDVNLDAIFFSYVFPLKNWTQEIFNHKQSKFISNLSHSLMYELDSKEDIIKATSFRKDDAICFLIDVIINIPKYKMIDACLPEWNKWVVADYQKRIEDPATDHVTLNKRIEYLRCTDPRFSEVKAELEAIKNKHEKEKINKIIESADYKALLKLLNDDIAAIEIANSPISKEQALDKFTLHYNELKKITGEINVKDPELDKIRMSVKEKRIEQHKEEEFWGFFARLYTLNINQGIDAIAKQRNTAILKRASDAGISEIGDLEYKDDKIDPKLVTIEVENRSVQVPVIARNEVGQVDYIETLRRIAIMFP